MITRLFGSCLVLVFLSVAARAQEPAKLSATEILALTMAKIVSVIEPPQGAPNLTFTATLALVKGEGLPKSLAGQTVSLGFQAPDRLTIAGTVGEKHFAAGRNRQQLWIYAPDKQFGVVGSAGVPIFASAPEKLDQSKLRPLKLPFQKEQLVLMPLLMDSKLFPSETIAGDSCYVLETSPKPQALQALKMPEGRFKLWVREKDLVPVRIGYNDGKSLNMLVEFRKAELAETCPEERWNIPAKAADHVEKVAVSHLMKFATVAAAMMDQEIPTLGSATGQRQILAVEGKGKLEMIDGTRVLYLKGTPEEMGLQHGKLARREALRLVNCILYGVGVGSSFEKGKWFLGEIEQAQKRLKPFMDPRYVREMTAIAQGAGCEKEEIYLANYFPELFHCSGFALYGQATAGGKLYHGRVLDYMRGVGLEQSAMVIVTQPDVGNAWVNVGYAGFVGSVTAMNEKHIAIGEMGGRGEGNWDGKPMAQLVREVMEKANTLDEAIQIMRKGPRTCEYYYVISDSKSKRAVGIWATPTKFDVITAGQSHPQLPHAVKDAVLMSAGERYETLVKRVQAGYGKFDAASARELMTRPVCMNSNLHSVLFDPETLDFWVANADSKNPASHTRFTQYNLAELLKAQ